MIKTEIIKCLDTNYCYLLTIGDQLVLIDASQYEPIKKKIGARRLDYIIITHDHHDHIGGLAKLTSDYKDVKIVHSKNSNINSPNTHLALTSSQNFSISNIEIKAHPTPGHSDSAYCFSINNQHYVGDTLFAAGCGKIPVIEEKMNQQWESIKYLKNQNINSQYYVGHEYTLINLRFAKTIDYNNNKITQRMSKVYASENKIFTPTTKNEELDTNPYFRTDNFELIRSVLSKLNTNQQNIINSSKDKEYQIFKLIRLMKNY